MNYRVTCLTPMLVGDGQKLAPIDYMVWKDHVNVLDQRRIFRLLSKGPRLENYLLQLKRSEKLDFASWGGFAQNFAGRRIPFEHPTSAAYWERSPAEALHIPTFASGAHGPYLPASALRGALRTGAVFAGLKEGSLEKVASLYQEGRPPRRPAEPLEERAVGTAGASRLRAWQVSDSGPVSRSCFKVYLLRVASLATRNPGAGLDLVWKQSPRGSVPGSRPEDGTPTFAEMASPGSLFEGRWNENAYYSQPEVLRSLNWRQAASHETAFEAANRYAAALLEAQARYAETAGLRLVAQDLQRISSRLEEVRAARAGCLLCLGWGGGLLSHVAWLKTGDPVYRKIIEQSKLYRGGYQALPFPKTRRVVFLEDRPAALPGWVHLEVAPPAVSEPGTADV